MDSVEHDDRGDLTDEERRRLAEIRAELEDTSSFLDDLLGGWNHGGKLEYQSIEEVAKAVAEAKAAAASLPS